MESNQYSTEDWNVRAKKVRLANSGMGATFPPAQGQDGVGHFNYYDRDRQLSFQWDGSWEEQITVSHGGYGEPVLWSFFVESFVWETDLSKSHGTRNVTFWFKGICDAWIASKEII